MAIPYPWQAWVVVAWRQKSLLRAYKLQQIKAETSLHEPITGVNQQRQDILRPTDAQNPR
jgi:hypothetical protein